MVQFNIKEFKLSDLPRWIPLTAAVLSVTIAIVGITFTFAFAVGVLTEAGDPVDAGNLESRYESIDEEALSRLTPRLSPSTD